MFCFLRKDGQNVGKISKETYYKMRTELEQLIKLKNNQDIIKIILTYVLLIRYTITYTHTHTHTHTHTPVSYTHLTLPTRR